MIILKLLSKLIKVLRAGPSPAQVAGGFTLGMFLGLMPGFNFYLNLLGLTAGWERLQVTDANDTWKNLIETGNARFNLAVEPLFYGRLIIEELSLEGFRSGTQREKDGKLPEHIKAPSEPSVFDLAAKSLNRELSRTAGIDLSRLDSKVNVDSLINIIGLTTPAKLASFQQDITTGFTRWQKEVQSLTGLESSAKQQIARLQIIKANKLTTLAEITSAIVTIKAVRDQVDSLQRTIIQKNNSFINDFSILETRAKSIDNWVKDDIQKVVSKARLPDLSAKNIARFLFGPALLSRFEIGLKYLNIANMYRGKLTPTNEYETPPRFKGQDIKFPDRRKLAKFWLKKMKISAISGSSPEGGLTLTGSINNITTDPQIVRLPAEIQLISEKAGSPTYRISALIDRISENSKDNFFFQASGISLNNAELGGSSVLPEKILKGTMGFVFNLKINSGVLDGKLDIQCKNVTFEFNKQQRNNRFANIARDILRTTKQINVSFHFSGKPGNPKIKLTSNLDNLFAARFKTLIGGQLAKGRSEINRRIKAELEPEKQKILSLYYQKRREIEAKIALDEKQTDEKIKIAEAK